MVSKVLLVTTVKWPSAARLAGAFAGVGVTVEAVFPRGHVLGKSRYLARGHAYRALGAAASLARAIQAAAPDLVVPADDRAVALLKALYFQARARAARDLETVIARSFGNPAACCTLMARSRFIAVAREEGIAAPESIVIADEQALMQGIRKFGYPAVLKADASWGGEGVVLAQTPEEALAAFRRLSAPPSRARSLARAVLRADAHHLGAALKPRGLKLNLQRFVAGAPATSAFACRDGEVLAAIHMDVVEAQGATGPATLLKLVDCPEMDHAARVLARRFKLSGLHGLDFVRDAAGRAHLIEINPRATQICHLALGPGRDLAAALVGRPARPTATSQTIIALFPQASDRDPYGATLTAAFRDVPWDDPGILKAALKGSADPLAVTPLVPPVAALRPGNQHS